MAHLGLCAATEGKMGFTTHPEEEESGLSVMGSRETGLLLFARESATLRCERSTGSERH